MDKINRGYWTLERQQQMCHALTKRIFRDAYNGKTSVTYQINKQADRFPVGLKQYYADKLLLNVVIVNKIIIERSK